MILDPSLGTPSLEAWVPSGYRPGLWFTHLHLRSLGTPSLDTPILGPPDLSLGTPRPQSPEPQVLGPSILQRLISFRKHAKPSWALAGDMNFHDLLRLSTVSAQIKRHSQLERQEPLFSGTMVNIDEKSSKNTIVFVWYLVQNYQCAQLKCSKFWYNAGVLFVRIRYILHLPSSYSLLGAWLAKLARAQKFI